MAEIRLESPFPLEAVPRVWQWVQQSMPYASDDWAPKNILEFVEDWLAQRATGRKTWAVLRNGEIGGVIMSTQFSHTVADLHVVFRREFWGHATTLPALALACEELFKTGYPSGIEKIETKVLPENRAVLAMVAAIGGTREGLARGHTLRNGKPIDVVMVGLERTKFDGSKHRWQLQAGDRQLRKNGDEQRQLNLSDQAGPAPGAGGDGAGYILGPPRVHDQPAGGGRTVANGSTGPGQSKLFGPG